MKKFFKPAIAAGVALAAVTVPAFVAPVAAQQVQGIGIANLRLIILNSSAYTTAQQQRQTTYAAQIQQANTRRDQIAAQLQPLVAAFEAARQQPNADMNTLQQQAAQIQQMQQQGQTELQQILAPVVLSQAYVEEQIEDQLEAAIANAAASRNVTLVISPENVLFADNAYNLNEAVLNALNALLPSAQLVPPQGWLPREMREQAEAAQAAQPAAVGR